MTLDEAIKREEIAAEVQEKAAKQWHENQVRKCELIPFTKMDYTHENECEECAEKHRQLAEWLKELKQLREQTRWIPVSEGLPYIGQRVLVTTETLDNGKKVTGTYYDRYGFVCGNVLAWMPLPKPYESQESEDA